MTASTAPLILASASPRRRDLLAQCGIAPARILPADIDETPWPRENPVKYVERIARAKAAKIAEQHPDAYVLAADTTVHCGQRILGKAENADMARAYLQLLSGRRHRISTAVSLYAPAATLKTPALPQGKHFSVTSMVKFKRLTPAEIESYLAGNDWVGKAGAYGIQGPAAAFVTFMSGSYTNIVGLPLYETLNALKGAGYVA